MDRVRVLLQVLGEVVTVDLGVGQKHQPHAEGNVFSQDGIINVLKTWVEAVVPGEQKPKRHSDDALGYLLEG